MNPCAWWAGRLIEARLSGGSDSRRERDNSRSSHPRLEVTRSEDLKRSSRLHESAAALRPSALLGEGPGIVGVAPPELLLSHPSSDDRSVSRKPPYSWLQMCTVAELVSISQPYKGVVPVLVEE